MMPGDCPVCQRSGAVLGATQDKTSNSQVHCPVCGDYTITEEADRSLRDKQWHEQYKEIRRKVRRWLYSSRSDTSRLLCVRKEAVAGWPGRILDFESAASFYADEASPLVKYETALRGIADQGETFGHWFNMIDDRWLIPTMDDKEADRIVKSMVSKGFLEGRPTTSRGWEFSLTVDGLLRAAELQREARTAKESVFVAACFEDEMTPACQAIRCTIDGLGYKSCMVLDPHTDLIDRRIHELVTESRFVVADLTWNRQSVYYEIGLAIGLGIEVVLTCRADHFEDRTDDFRWVHFDVNHRPIILWTSLDQLAEELHRFIYERFGAFQGGSAGAAGPTGAD